jgi:hypothetical protein
VTTDHAAGPDAVAMPDDQLITEEIRGALERDPHVHNVGCSTVPTMR